MSEHYEARFMFNLQHEALTISGCVQGSAEELLVRELPPPIVSLGEVMMAPSEDIRRADEDGKLDLRLVHLIKCHVTAANDRWLLFGLHHVKLKLHLMCCWSGDAPDVILSLPHWSRGEPFVATEEKKKNTSVFESHLWVYGAMRLRLFMGRLH